MVDFKIIQKYSMLTIGMFFMGLGVAIITKTNLGTSPISSIPYVLSMIVPLTFGECNALLNILLLFFEILLLKKDFPKKQFLQVFICILFGFFIDLGMFICNFTNLTYILKIIFLVIGCTTLALGIYLEVNANVLILPGDGLVKIITNKTGKKLGNIKIAFDCTLVISALVISLFAFETIKGLGEGTIISAVLVGTIIKLIEQIKNILLPKIQQISFNYL